MYYLVIIVVKFNHEDHKGHKVEIIIMKLRIKANSIRIRLTKTEVSTLANTGYLEELTRFINNEFVYAVQRVDNGIGLSAMLEPHKITMFVSKALLKDWAKNDVVGFNSKMPVPENGSLYLLLEKDFVCLDETTEDQSDNYENPNKPLKLERRE